MTEASYIKAEFPTGQSGDWTLETFEVEGESHSEHAPHFARLRPGTYSRLKHRNTVFMTDLYDEWFTQKIAIDEGLARGGHVLITGLGLGMIVDSLLQPADSPVERITLIELSEDVIRLVGPHLEARYGDRLTVHRADAYTWQPPDDARYSVVWHDIWPNPQDPAVEAEMGLLEARYGPFADWQGSWPREWSWFYEEKPWPRETGL